MVLERIATPVLGALGILYTVPSIALIILLLPFFGLNPTSVMTSCTVLAMERTAAVQDMSPTVR